MGVVSDSCENYNSNYSIQHIYNGTPSSGTTYRIFQDNISIRRGGGGLGCCHVEELRPLTDTVIFAAINNQGLITYINTIDGGANWSNFDFGGVLTNINSRFYTENTGYVMRYYSNDELHIKRISDIKPREIIYQTTLDTSITHIYISDTLYGNPYCPEINELVYKFVKDSTDIFVHIVFDVIISNMDNMEDKHEINIYPNPTYNYVVIDLENDCSLEITNIFGKIILKQSFSKGKEKLNLGNLKSGYYFLRLKTKNGIVNKTIIKL